MTKNKKIIPLFKVFMPRESVKAVIQTLNSGYLSEGSRVKKFTEEISKFVKNPYIIPVSSGTMALTIAYELAGITRGSEVISTPLTCVATNTPLIQLGAKIVWADCEENSGMIDPKKIEKLITKKTKAIVVLHKDGDLAKMDEILTIAHKYKIKVIEDAAHTFGAKYKKNMIGNIGDYTCFSFQAIKHLTTADGGAVAVKNISDYKKARKLKWFGLDKEEPHKHKNIWMDDIDIVGYKGNMNDLTASIGLSQIKYTKKIVDIFHKNGEMYSRLLRGINGVSLVDRDPRNYSTYWVYTLLVDNRENVMSALEREGVASSIVHPRNDLYTIFKKFKRNLPGVDSYSAREISIPCGWWVSKDDIKKIVSIIKDHAQTK